MDGELVVPIKNPEAYAQISAKYERAKKHIDDLDAYLILFGKEHPCTVGREYDDQAQLVTFYAREVPDPPLEISLILGDALQNLRSMLDYPRRSLAYCSSVKHRKTPPLPIAMPLSTISQLSWSLNPPPRSTSSMILSGEMNRSFLGRGVWRSFSRNWQCQP